MKFNITLTWSKFIALLILISAMLLDYLNTGNSAFMYALPFVTALILGRQGVNMVETLKNK